MKTKASFLSMVVLLAVSQVFCHADGVVINSQGDARLINEADGDRNDNNGGNTISGALIGTNTPPALVDNFLIHDFANLSAVAGQTVSGATVTIAVATGFMNANHGSVDDIINLSEIALGNIGWDQGVGAITGGDTPATDGSVSFNNRSEFNNASSIAWVDSGGAAVSDLRGALTLLGSQPGYNQGAAPPTLTFDIDAATAQRWVDFGLGGIALSATDDGNNRSRFNFQSVVGDNGVTNIEFHVVTVPEPSAGLVGGIAVLLTVVRRRRTAA